MRSGPVPTPIDGHFHAWELNDSGWHWLGTWATYPEMDAALDRAGDILVIDNVDPCGCDYGVGMGEPKEDDIADAD